MVGFLGNLEIPGGWDVVNQLKPPLCVWTILYEGETEIIVPGPSLHFIKLWEQI